ncbi:hypothetical protein E4U54_004204, partial [Claviceps lovelessii]
MLLIKVLMLFLSFTLTSAHGHGHSDLPPRHHGERVETARTHARTPVTVVDGMWHLVNDSFIREGVSCESCKSLLRILKDFAITDHVFVASGQEVCRLLDPFLRSSRKEICLDGVAEHGPLLAQVLRRVKNVETSEAANLLCNNFLHVCQTVKPKSNLALPKPNKVDATKMTTFSGRGSYKVVHFSDLHIDPLYEVGTSAECDNPILCCR